MEEWGVSAGDAVELKAGSVYTPNLPTNILPTKISPY